MNNALSNVVGSQTGDLSLAEQSAALASRAVEVYQQSLQIEQNVAAIHAQTNLQLASTAAKFMFCQQALLQTFGERDRALGVHYEALNRALESDDRECVIAALQGISTIVAQNPLESFTKIMQEWDNPKQTLELDF